MKNLIIGDLYLDNNSGSEDSINYQMLFFNMLESYLKKNKVEQITLLGDIFTNKKIIDFKIIAYATELFRMMSKYAPIFLINGNHVIYHRNNYDLDNSSLIFQNRKDINIMVPKDSALWLEHFYVNWKNTKEEYLELFNSFNEKDRKRVQYIYGHFEMFGFLLNRNTENKNEAALKANDFFKLFPNLKMIFSGHYHTPQKAKDIFYVGAPYELAWSEAGLKLGFHILDTDTNEVEFIRNPNTKHIYFTIDSEKDLESFETLLDNSVDYSRFYKVQYNKIELESDLKKLMVKYSKRGNIITLIENYSVETETPEEFVSKIENKNAKVTLDKNKMLDSYILEVLEANDVDKTELYEYFMAIYDEVKNNLSSNFEI